MEKIENAVIIHGPGRSGTTLVNNILSLHPDFSWLSGWLDRFPQFPSLAFLNRVQRLRTVERLSRGKRYWPRPAESYGFWKHFFPDFNHEPGRYSSHRDEDAVARCVDAIRAVIRAGGGARFITKLTGYSRGIFLREIFERPTIVWVARDPRAVVASFYKQRWGYKDRPAEFSSIDTRDLLAAYVARFRAIRSSRTEFLEDDFVELQYEELTARPSELLDRLGRRLGCSHSAFWLEVVRSWDIRRDANEAWSKSLGSENAQILEELLGEAVTHPKVPSPSHSLDRI